MAASREIEELLPAYLNGTLGQADRERVRQALAADPALDDELRYLQELKERLRHCEPGRSPGELGWRRLHRKIAAQASGRRPQPWRLAAAAAVLVIVAQGVLLWRLPGEPTYEMLGGSNDAEIQLRFAADARAGDIAELLAAEDLEIVSGPGAAGLYRLRTGEPATPDELDALVERLARNDRLVAFVARE